MTWTKLAIAVTGPIALLLFICTPTHAESSPAACNLLSAAEAEHAVRVPVGPARTRVNSELVTTCVFAVDGHGTVSVLLRRSVANGSHQALPLFPKE
jgi:hypothetical protein